MREAADEIFARKIAVWSMRGNRGIFRHFPFDYQIDFYIYHAGVFLGLYFSLLRNARKIDVLKCPTPIKILKGEE